MTQLSKRDKTKQSLKTIGQHTTFNNDADISEYECIKVLKAFKNNLSPGTDGLIAEFYKLF